MVFLDSTFPVRLLGASQTDKDEARRLLEVEIARGERLVTDAETFQELLRLYAMADRPEAIEPAFRLLTGIADEVLAVDPALVRRAKEIVLRDGVAPSAAIHLAVMERHALRRVLSFDSSLDVWPAIDRRPADR